MKEAKPSLYVKKILPILLRNRVVHFIGFGNRLSFDPIPSDLQVLLQLVTGHKFILDTEMFSLTSFGLPIYCDISVESNKIVTVGKYFLRQIYYAVPLLTYLCIHKDIVCH